MRSLILIAAVFLSGCDSGAHGENASRPHGTWTYTTLEITNSRDSATKIWECRCEWLDTNGTVLTRTIEKGGEALHSRYKSLEKAYAAISQFKDIEAIAITRDGPSATLLLNLIGSHGWELASHEHQSGADLIRDFFILKRMSPR